MLYGILLVFFSVWAYFDPSVNVWAVLTVIGKIEGFVKSNLTGNADKLVG